MSNKEALSITCIACGRKMFAILYYEGFNLLDVFATIKHMILKVSKMHERKRLKEFFYDTKHLKTSQLITARHLLHELGLTRYSVSRNGLLSSSSRQRIVEGFWEDFVQQWDTVKNFFFTKSRSTEYQIITILLHLIPLSTLR